MTTTLQLLRTVAEIFAVIALADFVAGVIHWIEDAYFTEDTPIIGPLFIKPNIAHHHLPRYFTRLSWWQSSKDLLAAGVALLAVAWWFDFLTWHVWLFVAVGVNANEVHKWSHRTRAENGPVISFLQDVGILQTVRHHALHHTDPKNTYYCPVTNFVNPVLEKISFWTRLESLIERLTGIRHREDTAVRGQGPGPKWLHEYRSASAPPSNTPVAAEKRTPTCSGQCRHCAVKCARHQERALVNR